VHTLQLCNRATLSCLDSDTLFWEKLPYFTTFPGFLFGLKLLVELGLRLQDQDTWDEEF
jgi:hypothetical protein